MATLDQIEQALRAADAAGNVDDARRLAQAYADMRDQQPKADFSGVTSTVDTTAQAPGQPQPRSLGQELGRSVGLGARGLLQGGADLAGIVADPFIHGANALGANQATMRQGANALADRIGLPSPETATERVSGDITGALAGGGGLIGLGRGLAARAPGVAQKVGNALASMPGTQVASVVGGSGASGTTREAGGGQGAQVAASLIGGLAPSFGKAGLVESVRRGARGGEDGRQKMAQGIRDFDRVGATASAGQASGNRRLQGLENLLAGAPTSGGVMVRAAERQAEDIGAGLQKIANNFNANASAERAGRAVEKGVGTFANNIRATRRALYWAADQKIPDTVRLPMTNTQRAMAELTALTPGAESTSAVMINPKISTLARTLGEDMFAAQATKSGGIPYSAAKDLRSRIGQELSDFSLSTDKPTAEYKRLYAALSQDMEQAAQQQGPEAMRAVRRANNYFKVSAERLDQLERVVDKSGGPEKVYNAVMAGTKDGGTTLRAVMQSLPKDGQQALTGAVIKRMGLANPGAQDAAGDVFSAQTFLTNWNKVSPEAKRALFDRHGPRFTQDMDRIARVADRIKDGSKVFANPSGTANRGLAFTYAGSLGGALLTGQIGTLGALASGGAVANVLARTLTNPRAVAWMARATELPVSALPQQVLILKAQARNAGDEDLMDFAELLESAEQEPEDGASAP